MAAKAFWTITEIAAETGEHHNIVRNWIHKLGLGAMAGTAYVIDSKERERLLWVFSLEHNARILLVRDTDRFPDFYPEAWERRPRGFKLAKQKRKEAPDAES